MGAGAAWLGAPDWDFSHFSTSAWPRGNWATAALAAFQSPGWATMVPLAASGWCCKGAVGAAGLKTAGAAFAAVEAETEDEDGSAAKLGRALIPQARERAQMVKECAGRIENS